jgi:hypothetical protein
MRTCDSVHCRYHRNVIDYEWVDSAATFIIAKTTRVTTRPSEIDQYDNSCNKESPNTTFDSNITTIGVFMGENGSNVVL